MKDDNLRRYLSFERAAEAFESEGNMAAAETIRDKLGALWHELTPQSKEWLDNRRERAS